MVSIQERSAC